MLGNGSGSISTVPYLLTDSFLSNSCGSVFIGVAGSKFYNYTIILKQYQRKLFEKYFLFFLILFLRKRTLTVLQFQIVKNYTNQNFFGKIRHFEFKEPDPGSGFGSKTFSIMLNLDPYLK
jgi:hypothetical protein